ncbi:MAG TPA: hypothetical protein VK195_11105, partial [Burkholderiaceae bacterium]|nr:hypothetical protein [Burkholderiaceae bacterium]
MVQSLWVRDCLHRLPRLRAGPLALASLVAALTALPAHAGDAAPPRQASQVSQAPLESQEPRYLLGLRISRGPEYPGSRRQEQGLTPLWALYWGRWRITTAGTGAMMGFGSEAASPG